MYIHIYIYYIILYSLTGATLMSPGQDETHVCGYIYIYISYHIYTYHNIISSYNIPSQSSP